MPIETVYEPSEIQRLSILDEDGNVDGELVPDVPEADLVDLYRSMLQARRFDERMLKLQRQGRIGTFAPVSGQEAAQLGSIYPLRETDWFVPSFRETAAALWRGAKMENILLYAKGFEEGSDAPDDARDLPIAIPVSSQVMHAVGVAWAEKMRGSDDISIVDVGDGATSEGDFHEAMNWSATFGIGTIFLCQNNQWAISVPREHQTKSRTIAQKALAYDVPGLQVDGNDILAMIKATRTAEQRARQGEGPTLIEAVTYRLSVHTTADDPTKYRDASEVEQWEQRDPLPRLQSYLLELGALDDGDHDRFEAEVQERIDNAVKRFEELESELGDPLDMFDYILETLPDDVQRQKREFVAAMRWAGRDDVLGKIDPSRPEVSDLLGGDA